MTERLALKRLTASDLTFFESLFRKLNAGNQKAINLNADVFVEQLYPALPALVPALGDVITISLTILGPNAASAHTISRAVTKRDAYKNWRLNGEFVRDPEGEAGRFDVLTAGDLAVLDFSGDPAPQRLTLLLVASHAGADAPLHAALAPLIPGGRKTMVPVTRAQLAAAAASTPQAHPVWLMAADAEYDAALEDAALGGEEGTEALKKKTAHPVSAATLAAAKASAEKNGRDGEALAWVHLQKLKTEGHLTSVEWSSRMNAVSSFDFRAVDDKGVSIRIDAKSTSGEFERRIHMSVAELIEAAAEGRYDLWRLYQINDDGVRLRIAQNISSFAKAVLAGLKPPAGVVVDSVSIAPSSLKWESEIAIERPDEASDAE